MFGMEEIEDIVMFDNEYKKEVPRLTKPEEKGGLY